MKNKTVPEIRYKNIEDEWKLIKLSDLINFSNGINAPKESYGRGRKMISVMDILSEERIEYKKIRNSVEVKESIESKNKVENGDLIFVRSSEVRNEVGWAKAYLQEQYALHSGFTIRGKKQNEYDAKFIECSLNYRNRYQIESKAGGSTRYNVGQEILKNVEIYIPSLKEQLLISTLIQNIENKINLHQQELDALKQAKQGFLQKMFPKNGETKPEFRFKEFTENWNEEVIGNIADFSKGNGYSKRDLVTEGTPILLYGQLYTNYKSIISSVSSFVSKKEKSIVSAGNEVVVPASGESSEDIARASAITIPGIIIGGDLNIIRPANKIEPIFLALVLSNGKVQRELSKFAQGKSVVHLQNSEIKKVRLTFPKIEEQIKIGEFFKRLDEVIELKEQELEALKQTKKGFLQKMFV